MKALRFIWTCLIMTAFTFGLSACSNDDEPVPEPTPSTKPYFEINHKASFLITKEAQTVEVPVKTNINTPNIKIFPDEANLWINWDGIRKEEKDENGVDKLTYSFSVKENTENRTRTGEILFCYSSGEPIRGFNIVIFTQAGVE